jgi:hypothetical protein
MDCDQTAPATSGDDIASSPHKLIVVVDIDDDDEEEVVEDGSDDDEASTEDPLKVCVTDSLGKDITFTVHKRYLNIQKFIDNFIIPRLSAAPEGNTVRLRLNSNAGAGLPLTCDSTLIDALNSAHDNTDASSSDEMDGTSHSNSTGVLRLRLISRIPFALPGQGRALEQKQKQKQKQKSVASSSSTCTINVISAAHPHGLKVEFLETMPWKDALTQAGKVSGCEAAQCQWELTPPSSCGSTLKELVAHFRRKKLVREGAHLSIICGGNRSEKGSETPNRVKIATKSRQKPQSDDSNLLPTASSSSSSSSSLSSSTSASSVSLASTEKQRSKEGIGKDGERNEMIKAEMILHSPSPISLNLAVSEEMAPGSSGSAHDFAPKARHKRVTGEHHAAASSLEDSAEKRSKKTKEKTKEKKKEKTREPQREVEKEKKLFEPVQPNVLLTLEEKKRALQQKNAAVKLENRRKRMADAAHREATVKRLAQEANGSGRMTALTSPTAVYHDYSAQDRDKTVSYHSSSGGTTIGCFLRIQGFNTTFRVHCLPTSTVADLLSYLKLLNLLAAPEDYRVQTAIKTFMGMERFLDIKKTEVLTSDVDLLLVPSQTQSRAATAVQPVQLGQQIEAVLNNFMFVHVVASEEIVECGIPHKDRILHFQVRRNSPIFILSRQVSQCWSRLSKLQMDVRLVDDDMQGIDDLDTWSECEFTEKVLSVTLGALWERR